MDLRKIKVGEDDFGLLSYDPGLQNTASCKSTVGYIDGDKGILRYRGYPIEELAEKSTYLETAYLIIKGELPDAGPSRDVDPQHHHAHDAPREHEEVHRGVPLRRPSDGHPDQHDRALFRRSTPTRKTSKTSSRAGCRRGA